MSRGDWPALKNIIIKAYPSVDILPTTIAQMNIPRGLSKLLNSMAQGGFFNHVQFSYQGDFIVADPDTNAIVGRIRNAPVLSVDAATGQLMAAFNVYRYTGSHTGIGSLTPSQALAKVGGGSWDSNPIHISYPFGFVVSDAQHATIISALQIIASMLAHRIDIGAFYVTYG